MIRVAPGKTINSYLLSGGNRIWIRGDEPITYFVDINNHQLIITKDKATIIFMFGKYIFLKIYFMIVAVSYIIYQ